MLSVADGNIYVTDLVMIGVLKRSLDILDGCVSLVERWNFSAAAPLLRLQLDSLLRLVYLATLKDADAVSMEIIKGHSFRNMKDREGKKLTDARLRDYARPLYPWIDKVYKQTSKLIHFSDKHYFLSVNSLNKQSRTVEHFIGEGVTNWPESEINSFLDAMGCTTDALLKVVIGWTISKQRAYETQK
ncbi:hypothetical protein ES703_125589 [subsurface metagenome]